MFEFNCYAGGPSPKLYGGGGGRLVYISLIQVFRGFEISFRSYRYHLFFKKRIGRRSYEKGYVDSPGGYYKNFR